MRNSVLLFLGSVFLFTNPSFCLCRTSFRALLSFKLCCESLLKNPTLFGLSPVYSFERVFFRLMVVGELIESLLIKQVGRRRRLDGQLVGDRVDCNGRSGGRLADTQKLERRIAYLRSVGCCSYQDKQARHLPQRYKFQDQDKLNRIDNLPAQRLLGRWVDRRIDCSS